MSRLLLLPALAGGCTYVVDLMGGDTHHMGATTETPPDLPLDDTGISCTTGTVADLEAWLEVTEVDGAPCEPSCSGNARFVMVLSNPCEYDITFEVKCPPESGGFVSQWDAAFAGGSRSRSYDCMEEFPSEFLVPAFDAITDEYVWDPALEPRRYSGTADAFADGHHILVGTEGTFEVE